MPIMGASIISSNMKPNRSLDDGGRDADSSDAAVPKLGRLDGLDIVHLQCHIGTDTVSLFRLGPRSTVGLDFSPAALRAARELAVRAGADIAFIEADVHGAVQALGADRFDLVYTGIGALCWIPRIGRWADVVAGLLRPGGGYSCGNTIRSCGH
jgi:SAM-dependent methyltransferase